MYNFFSPDYCFDFRMMVLNEPNCLCKVVDIYVASSFLFLCLMIVVVCVALRFIFFCLMMAGLSRLVPHPDMAGRPCIFRLSNIVDRVNGCFLVALMVSIRWFSSTVMSPTQQMQLADPTA